MSWLDWLFTPVCPLCQRPTATGDGCFCCDCATQLRPVHQADWLVSELVTAGNTSLPVIGWGPYRDTVRRALRNLKYEHHPEVGETFGRWIGQRWKASYPALESKLCFNNNRAVSKRSGVERSVELSSANKTAGRPKHLVVPIPLHSTRRQERGFNQAETIARAFCDVTGDRLSLRLLRRNRSTQPQFGLSARERSKNVQQAFVADACNRQRWPILLVDDIYTTGATVAAARQTLELQGWTVVAVLVVAVASLEQSS